MKPSGILLSTIILFANVVASGRTTWTIGGHELSVDTMYHATIGPGTTQTELIVAGQYSATSLGFNRLFYTTVDLGAENLEMRVAKAGDAMRALETVPEIASRFSTDSEIYFAGINADFFNMGYPYYPLGATISNGSLTNYNAPAEYADIKSYHLYFNSEGAPGLARTVSLAATGTATEPSGDTYPFKVNGIRGTNELVVYTHQWQAVEKGVSRPAGFTGTDEWGAEAVLAPIEGSTMWGDELVLKVVEEPVKLAGNSQIPEGCYVLSGSGKAISFVANLKAGDSVRLSIEATADGNSTSVKELVGGYPIILKDGIVQSTPSYPGHLSNPEPRTAVGYNADRSRLTMLVVDGRGAGGSLGVDQPTLAAMMKALGCTDAMNFDGGGSSTLFVEPLGIRNRPSTSSLDNRKEGEPRTVVNALFAVAVVPPDSEIAAIEIREKKIELISGIKYTPVVYGYNRYGVLVDTDIKDFTVSLPAELGTVGGTTVTAGTGKFRGALSVEYRGLTYSIPAYLNGSDGEEVSGIVGIAAEDINYSSATYFTPMGSRVERPQPGSIVIELRGSKATKRIVR